MRNKRSHAHQSRKGGSRRRIKFRPLRLVGEVNNIYLLIIVLFLSLPDSLSREILSLLVVPRQRCTFVEGCPDPWMVEETTNGLHENCVKPVPYFSDFLFPSSNVQNSTFKRSVTIWNHL